MAKYKFISKIFTIALVTSLLLSGCKKDSSSTSKVVPSFSVAANGKSVTFTNSSENATSYLWRFGDGDTSHATSPVHAYSTYGDYTVTLIAYNNAGSDSLIYKMEVTKSSPISLTDNLITDWASITTGYTNPTDLADNDLLTIKYDYDATYIYVYVEQTGAISDSTIMSIYLDTDADSTTGYKAWVFSGQGNDYLLQGQIVSTKTIPIYKFSGTTQSAFSWTDLAETDEITVGTVIEENGVVKYEFGFLRDKFTIANKKLYIGLVDSNKSWSEIGYIPYKLQGVLIDLTK
jgi:PKD repeat protein